MSLGPGTSELTPSIVDPPRMPARVATVAQQFSQRAARFGAHDAVLREVERRLVERLDVIRITPASIVDVGCGAGSGRGLLQARYPRASWIGIDVCEVMLARAGPSRGWVARLKAFGSPLSARVCADAAALPLADETIDLVYSNLMLHWHPQPHTLFPAFRRILRTDGLLLFSCFGPDTLKEVRAACALALPQARPLPFVDMHDFGDMLVAGGFAAPVMDVELLRLTYPTPQALLRELRTLGGNPRDDRPQALPSSRQCRALLAALDARRDADGRIGVTFEVAYGHAWKPQPRSARPAGQTTIALDDVRAQLRQR
ncbi:MAG: methyltransferase domain-containing protein [Burkholderiaceae bacterium]|jgi:malonyl-CoA O-methyltransferase|nr:methyltransferase domain-containing protein [Burkholderiaceae bacterium]